MSAILSLGSRAPAKPAIGLEEKLGTRWAVWVGGVALALGGAFLVRYAIEETVRGRVVGLAGGAQDCGSRREHHEEIERYIAGEFVKVPGAKHLGSGDFVE